MPTINLLYKDSYSINENIKVVIPTVGDIIDNEETYYDLVSMLTAMPIDMMVPLADAGYDFAELTDYDLFVMMFPKIKTLDTSLVFGDLDLTKFEFGINEQNGTIVFIDRENDIKIDRAIHGQIASTLRKIHHLEKNTKKPGNEEAKKYLIERARAKMRRNKNRKSFSQLEQLIVSMVNSEPYKYDFEGTRELSIYQFNESVRQVIKKVDYNNRMFGVYSGTISAKDLSQDDLNWLYSK